MYVELDLYPVQLKDAVLNLDMVFMYYSVCSTSLSDLPWFLLTK